MMWLFWREHLEAGKTVIVGGSDCFFTITAAFFLGLAGGCHLLLRPVFLEWDFFLWLVGALSASLLLLTFFDRFQFDVGADGYRLRSYLFAIICRANIVLPPETRFSVFLPRYDSEADRFAVSFFLRPSLRILAWLHYFRASVAEKCLLEIAGRFDLDAAKTVKPHESN